MRKQAYPVTDLTGGLDVSKDASLITNSKSPNLNLVRLDKGILRKDVGFHSFGSADANVVAFHQFARFDGTVENLLMTTNNLYSYANGSYIKNTTANFTGSLSNSFSMTEFYDTLILTNGKDPIKTYDGANIANLAGAANLLAKQVISFHNCLFLLNLTESSIACPLRVRWSDIGDANVIIGGNTSGAFDLADTPDHIVGASILGDRMFVFKQKSIWEIYYVGSNEKTFDATLILPEIGTSIARSIVSMGSKIGFVGADNIYLFDGASVDTIGDEVRPKVFDPETSIVNKDLLNNAPASYVRSTKKYVVVFPTESNNFDLMLSYDTQSNNWTERTQVATALGEYTAQDRVTWDTATGNWEDSNWEVPWSKEDLPPGTGTLLIANGVNVYEDNRLIKSNELMTWESKDFIFGHASRISEIRWQVKGDPFYSSYSLDEGLSWSNEVLLTPPETYFGEVVHPVDRTTQKVRVRVRTWNENFEMEWAEPWYIERTRSK